MSALRRLISHFWPVRIWHGTGRFGPLEVVWENGRLVVNTPDANQSFGNLHKVWQLCFADEAVREHPPRNVLILGYGAGSAATILRNELGITAPITGVDADTVMLGLAKKFFRTEQLPDLTLVEQDALEFLRSGTSGFDLIVVDLFEGIRMARGTDTSPFIQALRNRTAPGGKVCFNTVVREKESALRSERIGDEMRPVFSHVRQHRYLGINRVFIAM